MISATIINKKNSHKLFKHIRGNQLLERLPRGPVQRDDNGSSFLMKLDKMCPPPPPCEVRRSLVIAINYFKRPISDQEMGSAVGAEHTISLGARPIDPHRSVHLLHASFTCDLLHYHNNTFIRMQHFFTSAGIYCRNGVVFMFYILGSGLLRSQTNAIRLSLFLSVCWIWLESLGTRGYL